MKLPPVAERLAGNRFILDEEEPHIIVNQKVCADTGSGDRIIAACPAQVYAKSNDGTITAEYAACLECGTCFEVADEGALEWHYPRGGFGVQFREG